MKQLFLAFGCFLLSFVAFGQIEQAGRMELVSKEGGIGFTATLGEEGVLVFGPSETNGENTWEITRFNSVFKEVSKSSIAFNKRSRFLTHLFSENGKEVLLVFVAKNFVRVVSYEVSTGKTTDFQTKIKFAVSNASLLNKTLLLNGVIKKSPAIMALNLASGRSKMLMLPGMSKNTRIIDIEADHEQQLVAVSVRYGNPKKASSWQFEIAMYDDTGERIGNTIKVENEVGKVTMDASITWLGKGEFLLSGNYSVDNKNTANGLFLAAFSNERQLFIRYHNFSDMANFFEYLSKKAKARVEKKVARQKGRGKENAVSVHMVTHKISEFAGQYVLLGEAYFPTYRTVMMTTYVNGTPQNTTQQVFDGYQYTHATILGLDKLGDKLWDHCFEINIPQKPFNVRRNIRGIMTDTELRLFYPSAANLKSMIIAYDNSIIEKNLGQMQTQKEGDKVRREDLPEVEYWYGDYFLLSGSQRIRNKEEKTSAKNRSVFYLAKIKVDATFDPKQLGNEPDDQIEEMED